MLLTETINWGSDSIALAGIAVAVVLALLFEGAVHLKRPAKPQPKKEDQR